MDRKTFLALLRRFKEIAVEELESTVPRSSYTDEISCSADAIPALDRAAERIEDEAALARWFRQDLPKKEV